MSWAARWTIPAYLVLCVLLGGANAGGYLANAALQLIAIGLLLVAALNRPEPARTPSEHVLLAGLAVLVAVICLQFVLLPDSVWRSLPGRAAIIQPFEAAGIGFRRQFVSLAPYESLKSALWLLPAIGTMLAMMRARELYSGRRIALALVGAMCLSVLMGALQLASGPDSSLYFYHFTNSGSAVGFFANANHMASLLLVTIPFQAALLREALERKGTRRSAEVMGVAASFAVTVAGILVVGSLAGYGLLLPVSLTSALIVVGGRRERTIAALLVPMMVIAGLVLVLATKDGQAMLDQANDMARGSRQIMFATTWAAIRHFWPIGTGLGTFAEVYRSFENPALVTLTYINHAHNEYLELLLETGVAGLVAMVAFLVWWIVQAWRIWRAGTVSPFAMAGMIASASLLVHSLVDYPLRTAALSTVFAACLVLMAAPRPRARRSERDAIYGVDAG